MGGDVLGSVPLTLLFVFALDPFATNHRRRQSWRY